MSKLLEFKFGKDFHSEGGALTLRPCEVGSNGDWGEIGCSKTHPDGWTISGDVKEDYYTWVNDFEATHPEFGVVKGNFEGTVFATSKEALDHFMKHHPPQAWDYYDI